MAHNLLAMLERLVRLVNRADTALTARIALAGDQRRPCSPVLWLANVGAHLGDSVLWAVVSGWLWWRAGSDPRRKRPILGWLASFVAALLITLSIKRIFKRRRPGGGRFLYGRGADVHSFPSGHGARSGVILVWASALHPLLGKWAPLLILWIAWSRVAIGVHYVGDVAVGFLLGVGVGKWVQWLWRRITGYAAP